MAHYLPYTVFELKLGQQDRSSLAVAKFLDTNLIQG